MNNRIFVIIATVGVFGFIAVTVGGVFRAPVYSLASSSQQTVVGVVWSQDEESPRK